MWFRFFSIGILHWIANLLAVLISLRFVIPHAWTGFVKALSIWALSFVITFYFAEWAFAKRLPSKGDLLKLLGVWLVVNYTLNVLGSLLAFQTARVALYGRDLHITTVVQILAVLFAAFAIRRQRLQAVGGEGIVIY